MGKKEKIEKYYHDRGINLLISYICSVIGGFVASVCLAMVLGQTPQTIYQHFGLALYLWAILFTVITIIFGIFLYLPLVYLPRLMAFNILKKRRKLNKSGLLTLIMEMFGKNKRRTKTVVLLVFLSLSVIIFFATKMNPLAGIVLLMFSLSVLVSNNEKWGNQLKGELGTAMFAGLIVSLIHDVYASALSSSLQSMYFLGFAISFILMTRGALED